MYQKHRKQHLWATVRPFNYQWMVCISISTPQCFEGASYCVV